MARNSLLSTSIIAGGTLLFFYVVHAYRTYQRNLRMVDSTPGIRTLFSISSHMTNFLPNWKVPWTGWTLSVDSNWWATQRYQGM